VSCPSLRAPPCHKTSPPCINTNVWWSPHATSLPARLRARQQHELASWRVTPGHARRRRFPPPRRQRRNRSRLDSRAVGYHSEFRVPILSCPSALILLPQANTSPPCISINVWWSPHASIRAGEPLHRCSDHQGGTVPQRVCTPNALRAAPCHAADEFRHLVANDGPHPA